MNAYLPFLAMVGTVVVDGAGLPRPIYSRTFLLQLAAGNNGAVGVDGEGRSGVLCPQPAQLVSAGHADWCVCLEGPPCQGKDCDVDKWDPEKVCSLFISTFHPTKRIAWSKMTRTFIVSHYACCLRGIQFVHSRARHFLFQRARQPLPLFNSHLFIFAYPVSRL